MGSQREWMLRLLVAGLFVLMGSSAVRGDDRGEDKEADHGHHNTHDDNGGIKEGKEFADGHHSWGYNIMPEQYGTAKWNTLYPDECGSTRKKQSPIDIVRSKTTYSEQLGALDILYPQVDPPSSDKAETEDKEENTDGAETKPPGKDQKQKEEQTSSTGMSLFSNGHTVQVNIERDILLVGAELGSQYKVAQFHFHWGKGGNNGTEHQIDGHMFMLEMHIVTYDTERFANLGEAVGTDNGIAVFGILFKKGKHNSNLNNVVNNLQKLNSLPLKTKIPIDWFDIGNVLPAKRDQYFRYEGSLTTPNCAETVKWTVFDEHPTICPSQMMQFYNMTEGLYADGSPVKLVNNWRPPQPLNGRVVYSSFSVSAEEKLVEYNVDTEARDTGVNTSNMALTSLFVLLTCLVMSLRL